MQIMFLIYMCLRESKHFYLLKSINGLKNGGEKLTFV